MTYYVFKLKNTDSCKSYFGYSTANPMQFTFSGTLEQAESIPSLKHLYYSMKKYGVDAFNMTILATKQSLNGAIHCVEMYIDANESTNPKYGYNTAGVDHDILYRELAAHYYDIATATCSGPEESISNKFDKASNCIDQLKYMSSAITNCSFAEFALSYEEFNKLLPITGVYDHMSLSIDSLMRTLYNICKDSLAVYLKENNKM